MAVAPNPAPPKETWRVVFAKRYPQYASMVDGGVGEQQARAIFGDEFVNIIYDLARNPKNYSLTTEAGRAAFDALVMATPYYQNTSASKRNFDSLTQGEKDEQVAKKRIEIITRYGDYYLSVQEVDRLSKEAARANLVDTSLDYFVAQRVGGRRTGRRDLLRGTDAEMIRKVAAAYGYAPKDLDDQIMSVVTGEVYAPTGSVLTADAIRNKARDVAKGAYFHLSNQLDAGLTIDDIFSSYRDVAARVLERDPDTVKFNDPLFSEALSPVNGQQMTLGDWERKIKSDDRYGYQFTTEANKAATNIGLAIARAFGKYR